jgi:hypothetical protein
MALKNVWPVRLSDAELNAAKSAAQKDLRTTSNWLRLAIVEKLEENGLAIKSRDANLKPRKEA